MLRLVFRVIVKVSICFKRPRKTFHMNTFMATKKSFVFLCEYDVINCLNRDNGTTFFTVKARVCFKISVGICLWPMLKS